MPCTRTGSLEGDRALAAEEAKAAVQAEALKVTQLLCAACELLDRTQPTRITWPPGLAEWWDIHAKQDRGMGGP